MTTELPPCPQCSSNFTYLDGELLTCPECGHEWSLNTSADTDEALVVKDAHGNTLQPGDTVVLIKDLKVKGSSGNLKIGTKAKINSLVDGDHNIDCKVDGAGAMLLKSEFVKRS